MQRLRILLVLATGIPFHASAADRLSPVSVCDLVAKRTEYNGRIISVRGQVMPGGHGPYLAAWATCSYQLVTRGVAWPNIISLVYPSNDSRDVTAHAPFALDRKATRAADDYLLKSGFRAEVDVEVATYVGLFVTYSDLDNRVNPGLPGALRLGFGPAGLGAPGQLVIKTVKDVSVTRGEAVRR
jgi:hypothetical protein